MEFLIQNFISFLESLNFQTFGENLHGIFNYGCEIVVEFVEPYTCVFIFSI